MAATYPEMFKAATAYSGVPAGRFVSFTLQSCVTSELIFANSIPLHAGLYRQPTRSLELNLRPG